MMKSKRGSTPIKSGFTLTELLIVVSIIIILAVLITAFLRTQLFKGNDARRKADIKRIGIAVEEYEKDNNCYPLSSLVVCTANGAGLKPYLDKIPCDPVSKASYYYEHEDSVCPKWYSLYTNLQIESDSDYLEGLGPNGAYSYSGSSSNAQKAAKGGLSDFYGCFSGACTQIYWDSTRPGPECDPNFQNSTCYGQCANPDNECKLWNQ